MAITLTAPTTDRTLVGTGGLNTAAPDQDMVDLEVWVTSSASGARLFQIPDDAIIRESVSWSETLGALPSHSATVSMKRYAMWPDATDPDDPDSYIARSIEHVNCEIQIVYGGRVRHWGPVVKRQSSPFGAVVSFAVAGPEWWLGLHLVPTDLGDFGQEQIHDGGPYDPVRDVGTDPWSWQRIVSFTSSDWRFTAEVYVPSSVPDDTLIFSVEMPTSYDQFQPGTATVHARDLERDQWVTAVLRRSFRTRGFGSQGKTLTLKVEGTAGVQLREVSAQVSPVSVGLPEDEPQAVFHTPGQSWMEIISHVAYLNIYPWFDSFGSEYEVGWNRPDVYLSEAARQAAESGDFEASWQFWPTTRVAQLWARRGRDIPTPDVLTKDNGNVISWGDWEVGIDHPANEWIVADDDGFTGRHKRTDLYPGLTLQRYVAAQTGTPTSLLDHLAEREAKRSDAALTERLTVEVPMRLLDTINVGDRVQVQITDGPDFRAGFMRVQGKSVAANAPGFALELSEW